MTTIGWAVLGPGRHADGNVLPQLQKAKDTKLVAVVSRDASRGRDFAAKYGFARSHTSLDQALADGEVQAIYDATPDALHASNAIAAAKAGRHALIEKPLAFSVAQAREAIEACKRHGVKLGVVFNQRHDAIHQEARRSVLAGEIGDVLLVRVQIPLPRPAQSPPPSGGNWRADRSMRSGGILMSIGDHAFDTLAYIAGQHIEEVCAFTDDATGNERVASMSLRLSKGAVGHAVSSNRTPFARRPIEIHGTEGTIILRNTYTYLTGAGRDATPSFEVTTDKGRSIRHFPPTETFRLEVEQFNRAIAGEAEPMTTAAEGLRAMAVTEALYESVRTRRVVRVADFLTAGF